MASQAIKEYNDFAGQDGYLIVDGLDDQTPGGKKLLSDLGGSNVPNYPTTAATSDTERYHLKVYNQAGNLQVSWDNVVEYGVAYNGGLAKASGGSTINFSIDTGDATDGDVLTYNGTAKQVEWTAPAGGGGNPYTKVEVTPEAAVLNGKMSDYNFLLFDQSVNIANNTLSVIPGGIGYEERENPDPEGNLWSKAIDVFKIILPAGTDFPMAVVEFPLTPNKDASINTIEVYVGSTKLTQIRDVPYREDAIVGNSISAPNGVEKKSNYWEWANIYSSNLANGKTAIVNLMENWEYPNPKVQVHIFGSCYRVMASVQTETVPAS